MYCINVALYSSFHFQAHTLSSRSTYLFIHVSACVGLAGTLQVYIIDHVHTVVHMFQKFNAVM